VRLLFPITPSHSGARTVANLGCWGMETPTTEQSGIFSWL
jgi:hypothetical protein